MQLIHAHNTECPNVPLLLYTSSGSILTSGQPTPPHQPASSDLLPQAKGPRTDMQPQHQTPMQQYGSYLKSVYTREKLPVYDKWLQVKSKIYINLALIEKEDITKPEADQFTRATIHGNIDDIKKSKRSMGIGQIAQLPDGSQPKCILVEGAPGVGKSTLAWKLCHKWGKGELLQQYQLVVLLRLRDEPVQAAKNISDLFRYHKRHIQQAAVEKIQDTGGKGVLLLFEGYDELPEKLRRKSSVFLDVITRRELPEATVLITSRPWASEFLHRECKRHISQHIEILGFTKDNIQFYLESTIPDDPSLLADLKKYISCYPHINSMMYIPLYCVFVVKVYQNSRRDEGLVPKTMTELYFSLVRDLLRCHHNDDLEVHSFNDLSKDAPDIYQQLCILGKIAYEGIRNDQQIIFHRKDFEILGLSLQDFETLGLMQRVRELYVGEATAVSYNFLHLTVQEYLAAFHLSQQPVEKQIKHFRKYEQAKEHKRQWSMPVYPKTPTEKQREEVKQQRHFHMVLRFLCGITQFKEYSNEQLNTFLIEDSGYDSFFIDSSDEESGDDSSSVVRKVTFNTLHWLFEAHDSKVIAKVLGSSDIQPHERVTQYGYYGLKHYVRATPFDCFVLGYCVSHSNCTWKISCDIGDEGVEMLVRGAVEEETHCTGGISEMNLTDNDITSEGVKHLLSFPKQLINKLKALNLSANLGGNNLDSESCTVLAHLIPLVPHLKKLNLSDNHNIGQGGTVPLVTSLTAHNSLEKLLLDNTGIGVEDCRALSKLLSSSTSLKELDISCNDLPPAAVELIISGLHHNTTLKWLDMGSHLLLHEIINSHFSLQNTISLASVLRTNHTLVDLNLEQCNIDSDGACQLASALCTNDTLQELYLGDNPIGVKGATAFAEMLRTNHTLVDLNLGDCNIDSDGACQLASALCTNDTLQELYLEDNPIGVEGATAFAEMLLKNKSLKKLNLQDDSIGEEGTQKLIDSLTHNTTLEELVLPKKYKSSITSSDTDHRVWFF